MHIVVSNLYDPAWVYQDLLDEVREADRRTLFTSFFMPHPQLSKYCWPRKRHRPRL